MENCVSRVLIIAFRISWMSGGRVPGVMEEVWESSEELSPLRESGGDGFLIVSWVAEGETLSSSFFTSGVSNLFVPFSGCDFRIEVGICNGVVGGSRNGTGGKTFSAI